MSKREGSAALSFILLLGLVLILALGGYIGYTYMQTPLLTELSPNPARASDTVTLHGDRFSTEIGGNIVLFGDKAGKVVRATSSLLEVQVPDVGLLLGEQVRLPVRVLSRGRVSGAIDLAVSAAQPRGEVEEIVSVVPSPSRVASSAPAAGPKLPVAAPSAASAAPGPPPSSPGAAGAESAPRAAAPAPKRPRPPAAPAPSPATGPDVADLLSEAEAAATSRRYEAAASLYDKALQADPQNAKAKAGRASAQAATASLKRSFTPGKTQAEGKAVSADKLKEFDTGGVSMKKPAEVPAHLEFEVSPAKVKAGDSYSVKVYLKNDGGKPLRISALIVVTTLNGDRSGGPAPARVQEVASGERAYVYEAAGVWKDGVTSWTLEVQIASGRGDRYRNSLTWQ